MTQSSFWQPSDIKTPEGANAEPETPKRRGRIPQSAWPHILERHRSGATLSAIAREFACTPSAISYILKKAEAAGIEPAARSETEATAPPAKEVPAAQTEPAQPRGAPAGSGSTSPADADKAADANKAGRTASARSRSPSAGTTSHSQSRMQEVPPAARATAAVEPAARAQASAGELKPAQPAAAAPPPKPEEEAAAPAPGTVRTDATPQGEAKPRPPASEAPRPARAEPVPPIDEVEARLREKAKGCLGAYRAWRQSPNETSMQSLSDAVHELRRVLARIEIEMAATRREEHSVRPIPIHRASRRNR